MQKVQETMVAILSSAAIRNAVHGGSLPIDLLVPSNACASVFMSLFGEISL